MFLFFNKMFTNLFMCGVLFVSLGESGNSTIHKKVNDNNTVQDFSNKTKITLVSEGGTLLPNTPGLSLLKDNFTSLMDLEKELFKTKGKSVVPRKGVDNSLVENSTVVQVSSQISGNSTSNTMKPEKVLNTSSSIAPSTVKITKSESALNKTSADYLQQNVSVVHKKPLILSYEALAKMEKSIQNDQTKSVPVVTLSKTTANNQKNLPNEDSIVKVYPAKAINSHPGMIMPIVITILVVPMFAIVGYMALKRGREAWKNRHYKRMDFLLDGMYND